MYLSVQMNYSNENKIWILILQIKPCYMGSLTYCEQIKYLDASKYMHSQTFLNAHLKLQSLIYSKIQKGGNFGRQMKLILNNDQPCLLYIHISIYFKYRECDFSLKIYNNLSGNTRESNLLYRVICLYIPIYPCQCLKV